MFRSLLVLWLAVGVVTTTEAEEKPARVVTLKDGDKYVQGVLVVPRADKRTEAPEKPEQFMAVGGSGGSVGSFGGRDFVSPKQLTAKDYLARRPTIGVSVYDAKADESPVAKSLKPSDIISKVGAKAVGTPNEFASAMGAIKGRFTVTVHRFDYNIGWIVGVFDSDTGRTAWATKPK